MIGENRQSWIAERKRNSSVNVSQIFSYKIPGKCIVTILFLVGWATGILASDELWLTGKVLDYNVKSGEIKVDVKSESCRGIRTFLTEPGLPENALKGKEIDFGIDSSICEDNRTYRIRTRLIE